jgi:undecaprenyl-diphosphatase
VVSLAVAERYGRSARRLPLVPTLALAAFALVAVAVERGGRLVALDHRIADWLVVHRSVAGLRVATGLIYLGEPNLMPFVLLALAGVLSARRRSWEPIRVAAIAVAALSVVVLGTKEAFGRGGPAGQLAVSSGWRVDQFVSFMHRGAFPSGHTTTAIVTWTTAVVLIRGRLGRAGLALVSAVALVVGASLVYAGFHWLSDVLGAYALGIALSWALVRITRRENEPANRMNCHVPEFLIRQPVTTRSQAGA